MTDETSTTTGQVSVLRHLSREQVISPQQLSPRHLLQPYPSRPDFSQAFPLGPPTAYAHTHDPFIRYGLDPLEDAQLNPSLLSEFVTSMGKIKPRGKTGLQRKTQRKVGKAIRRARVSMEFPTWSAATAASRTCLPSGDSAWAYCPRGLPIDVAAILCRVWESCPRSESACRDRVGSSELLATCNVFLRNAFAGRGPGRQRESCAPRQAGCPRSARARERERPRAVIV